MMSLIWQFILKKALWVWLQLWLGLHLGEWSLGLSGLGDVAVVIALILFTRMAMHPGMEEEQTGREQIMSSLSCRC